MVPALFGNEIKNRDAIQKSRPSPTGQARPRGMMIWPLGEHCGFVLVFVLSWLFVGMYRPFWCHRVLVREEFLLPVRSGETWWAYVREARKLYKHGNRVLHRNITLSFCSTRLGWLRAIIWGQSSCPQRARRASPSESSRASTPLRYLVNTKTTRINP